MNESMIRDIRRQIEEYFANASAEDIQRDKEKADFDFYMGVTSPVLGGGCEVSYELICDWADTSVKFTDIQMRKYSPSQEPPNSYRTAA